MVLVPFAPFRAPVFVQAFNGAPSAAFLPIARIAGVRERAIPFVLHGGPIATLANRPGAD
ncbi:hypothetical protein [Novosphingobium sp. CCH12-A3]|uniref:hypothetical protein n=1 Tax=Novosphingobium sp. CCH12-A3 TaxID=1768752 RepID=UPI0007865F4F|nr:hypothetical protein [Novosphingobium sp. CCH12-A3]